VSFNEFFKSATASGVILMLVTIIALFWANSSFYESYLSLWHLEFHYTFVGYKLDLTMHQLINDGLMDIFFFLVGLEIKRELIIGELSSVKKAALPIIAAFGGVVVPALIYYGFNFGLPSVKGAAIPMATDIAFALGALALLGNKVPLGIKIFLAALAIADDLAAVLVIAIFYTSAINITALAFCLVIIIFLFIANRLNLQNPLVYVVLGLFLWLAMIPSGIHATIGGIITAMFVPVNSSSKRDLVKISASPLVRIEHSLGGYVAFLIMPLFAFSNAGIRLTNINLDTILNPVSLGIFFGLFIGKPIGISLFVWLSLKFKLASLPENISLQKIFAVSMLCGIGFTMSLFVSNLSFEVGSIEEQFSKISIFAASLLAGVFGYFLMKFNLRNG